MAQPITKLDVSTSEDQEDILRGQDFKCIDENLNTGTTGRVYLWYKKESQGKAITRIQFSYNPKMQDGLRKAGYTKIDKDLNTGAENDDTGAVIDQIFLWYFCGGDSDGALSIVELQVTTKASDEHSLLKKNYERLGCNLNQSTNGNFVYLFAKRKEPTYIYEIIATSSYENNKQFFEQNYTRIDESTNYKAGGDDVFLWYRRTTEKKKALSDLDISLNRDDEDNLKKKGYNKIDVDLNKGTGGNKIYLWTCSDKITKIQAMNLLVNPTAPYEYQKQSINVIDKNLNEGTDGVKMYLAYK